MEKKKWKRHHKELFSSHSIFFFIIKKKPFYCRHHGRSWSLTCDWSQQLGVAEEKSNPFAPLQHTNGISPIWPSTLLFFSLGYDVITAWGWRCSVKSKLQSVLWRTNACINRCWMQRYMTECSANEGGWSSLGAFNKFKCSLYAFKNRYLNPLVFIH